MDKLFEVLKTLVEEPEKIVHKGFVIVKALLTLIFAEWAYRKLMGPYTLINIISFKEWVAYILSGRVLVSLLILGASHLFLFYLLSPALFIPIQLFAKIGKAPKKVSRDERKFLIKLAKWLHVLDIDVEKKRFIAMENTDVLFELASQFIDETAASEARELKDSLADQIGHTYLVFVVVYCWIIPPFYHLHFLNIIVYTGIFLIACAYACAGFVIDVMTKIAHPVIFMARTAKGEKKMEQTFRQAGVHLGQPLSDIIPGAFKFNWLGKKYLIRYYPDIAPITVSVIEQCAQIATNYEGTVFLLYDRELTDSAAQAAGQHAAVVKIVCFKGEQELEQSLAEMIKRDFA